MKMSVFFSQTTADILIRMCKHSKQLCANIAQILTVLVWCESKF